MRIDTRGREINNQVIWSGEFASELKKYCDFFTGVPDSVLAKTQENLLDFVFSSRENHAISLAFGALIGGAKPCVLMQNSGLGLSIDSLLGLFRLYHQGIFIVVSNRGELEWEEVQHKDWGQVTKPLLKALDFKIIELEQEGVSSIDKAFTEAYCNNRITILLVKRGNLDE